MVEGNDQYALVVVGSMNPSIHHPSWYNYTKILTSEETKSAESTDVVCIPQYARLSLPQLEITCQQDRWQVATPEAKLLGRITEIASSTFEILDHTPISAYGRNFSYHRATLIASVQSHLAKMVEGLPIGLDTDERTDASAGIRYTRYDTGRDINIRIEPSVGSPNAVFVYMNFHYRTVGTESWQHFDLRPLLESSLTQDHDMAERQLSRILEALSAGSH